LKQLARRRFVAAVLAVFVLAAGCSGGGGSSAKSTSSSSSSSSASSSSSSGPKAKKGTDPSEAAAPDPSGAAYIPTGPLVADNGFRPETDGFAFQNYGKTDATGNEPVNMGPDEMRKMFGDVVCADIASGKCDLTPVADQWMVQANAGADGGHCQGFSVLSGMLWKKVMNASDFGAPTTPALPLTGNVPLQRNIAYAFNFQVLDNYNKAIIKGTPNEMLDKLLQVLTPTDPDSYTLGIYKPGFKGGHAVTPYAVEDSGGGIFNILIYDNNYPTVTRNIKIDRNLNTWSYNAATNPNEPSELYEGDANTKTLDVEPTSPGIGVQPAPFAGTVASGVDPKGSAGSTPAADNQMQEFYLDGSDYDHAHLLITNSAGQRTGYVDGNLVNEIPGALINTSKANQTWKSDIEPDYKVPDGDQYTVTVDGSGLVEGDPSAVGVIGPGYNVYVSNLFIEPGEKSTMVFEPYAEKVTFSSTGVQAPTFDIGVTDTAADFQFLVSASDVAANSTVSVALPVDGGTLAVSNDAGTTYDLAVDRFADGAEPISFKHDGVALADGDTGTLQFGGWTSKAQSIPFTTTHNGTDSSQDLTNQA
jgi:hypothetical protein